MTFAVVYLLRAQEFVIVHDVYVQDLNTAKLKNNGCNSNQDFLVFVSLENGELTDNEPDFNAMLMYTYHPTINACYICRVKKFFGRFSCKFYL